jgi:hypothetical protein
VASRPTRTATRGNLLAPDELRKHLAHPEWFHIYRDGDATNISVNLYRVPAPDRVLVTNVTGVVSTNRQISLLFGQALPGSPKLSGLMNMVIPKDQLRRTIYASPQFGDQLDDYASRNDVTPTKRSISADLYPTERIVTERASLVSIAFANDDCEWRFYRVSPTDLRAANEGNSGAPVLYPVVQVIMDTTELVHLMHTLKEAVPKDEGT